MLIVRTCFNESDFRLILFLAKRSLWKEAQGVCLYGVKDIKANGGSSRLMKWMVRCDMEQNHSKHWISGLQAMGTLYNLS